VGRLPKAATAARPSGTATRASTKRPSRARPRTETLGDRIRNLRRERGLTNPGMRSLILMADALEVRPHSLLEETSQSEAPWVLTRAGDQEEVANDGGTARTITSNMNPRFNAFDFSGGPRKYHTFCKPRKTS
jgi:hypothetical protein